MEASRELSETGKKMVFVDTQLVDTKFSVLGDIAMFNNEKAKGRGSLGIVFK
jgi:hypothetical protein